MNYEDLINQKFDESVKGINDDLLLDFEGWFNYVITLPKQLRIVYTITILHQQIFNGGFHQYFLNAYGMFGYLTLDSLKTINANSTRNLLKKVLEQVNYEGLGIEVFNKKIFERQLDKIITFDDTLFNLLEDFDDEYYESEEDLLELLGIYLDNQD